jgi:competence protein ComEC
MKSRFLSCSLLRLVVFLILGSGLFAQGEFTVTVLDFKTHGLAAVLKTPGGKTWLVDTALRPTEDYFAASDVIGPFLERAGVKALDGIVISHPHGDHFGGLPFFVGKYPIGKLIDGGYEEIGGAELETYRKIRARYVAGGGNSVFVKTGDRLQLDPDLEAEILWPPPGLHRPDPTRTDGALYNGNSVVLRVRHGANVFLFPGDNHGIAGLAKFMDPEKLKCDLLVAPHHGLNSNAVMASATKPKFVIVSSLKEYQKPEIHPYELTKEAFEPVGSTVYATWVHGDITAVSDGKTIRVTTARQP